MRDNYCSLVISRFSFLVLLFIKAAVVVMVVEICFVLRSTFERAQNVRPSLDHRSAPAIGHGGPGVTAYTACIVSYQLLHNSKDSNGLI